MTSKEVRHARFKELVDRYEQQKDFAREADIPAGYVSQIYNGVRSLGAMSAAKVEKRLNLEPGYLTGSADLSNLVSLEVVQDRDRREADRAAVSQLEKEVEKAFFIAGADIQTNTGVVRAYGRVRFDMLINGKAYIEIKSAAMIDSTRGYEHLIGLAVTAKLAGKKFYLILDRPPEDTHARELDNLTDKGILSGWSPLEDAGKMIAEIASDA